MTLKNISGTKLYQYLCPNCWTVEFMAGDHPNDPLLEQLRDEVIARHVSCCEVMEEHIILQEPFAEETVKEDIKRRKSWGKQKDIYAKVAKLVQKGEQVEMLYDENRSYGDRHGYRRLA